MLPNKTSYFQGGGGVNEPSPKKTKYKSEPAPVNMPRFEEPFYRNYDLYDVPGKHGPGTGAYHMDKHKSIKKFLDKKRKKIRGKYKNISQENRLSNIKARKNILLTLIKKAIDFPTDNYVSYLQIDEPGDVYEKTVRMDGLLDKYLPIPDFEGKTVDKLNFGRDYDSEVEPGDFDSLDSILDHLFTPKETDLFGLPNGFDPEEDLDADKTINDINSLYGTTDSGNTVYSNTWF